MSSMWELGRFDARLLGTCCLTPSNELPDCKIIIPPLFLGSQTAIPAESLQPLHREKIPLCGAKRFRTLGEFWQSGTREMQNASSSVTPLHFVATGQGSRGRSLASLQGGWRLNGNLHTLGYFSAEVCVGSRQQHTTFDLIVDTGSSLTALPCAGCSHCGHHKNGARYQVGGKGRDYACSHPPPGMSCTSCFGDGSGSQCGYSLSYTEGSSIRGHMVEDTVVFASATGPKEIPIAFGCQTYESGLFYSQVADGIVGFSPRGSFGQTLHERVITATQRCAHHALLPSADTMKLKCRLHPTIAKACLTPLRHALVPQHRPPS